jgi:tetratricopeptide (TPR) repeat protein
MIPEPAARATEAVGPTDQELSRLRALAEAQPTNTVALFELADGSYDRGAAGDAKAVLEAEAAYSRLLDLEPAHALAKARLGSVQTMRARDTFWPNRRLHFARLGNRTMDAAVAMAPQDPEVRLVRAENNFHMPRFMDREQTVEADFAWLWAQVRARPETLRERLRQATALYQGLILKKHRRLGEALEVWKIGLEMNPESKTAARIERELKAAQP